MKYPCVRALCGVMVGALAACSVGPAYRRPDIPPPARWHESVPPAAASDRPVADSIWPDADWWRRFGSSQLDDLIDRARLGNDDLGAAVARVEEADVQVRIAGAPLFPTLDFNADATRERTFVAGQNTRLVNVFAPQLTASYELDFWGKNRAQRAAARAAALASRFDQQTVALTIVSSVATTYFQALEARDRIRVAEDNLANGRRILGGLQLEQTAGTATGLDVAQQATAVALLDAALPPLRQQFSQSLYALAVLLGATPESIELAGGSLADLSGPPVIAGLPSQLLARRPDIAEAEQQLIGANADITVARAALFPSIDLTAAGGFESSMLKSLISPANRVYSVGAGLTQPIFHAGALHAQVSFAKARYTELLRAYHKTVLTAFGNVESALAAARQTAEQQDRQREAVAAARRAYQFAQAQLSAGTVNILTVLNTENALFSAQDVLVQVQYAHLQSMVGLFTALGGGWKQG